MTSSPPAIGNKQFTALLAAIMALGALGIDLMLPVFDEIRTHFGLAEDATDVAQIVTVYFLGMASGQIFYGPFADRYGRRPVLYVGLVIYAIAAVGSVVAPTLPLMLLSRFLWGVGAAGPRVMAVAVVRDVYSGDAMARAMSFIMAVFVTVPILAPSLGAGIAALGPWQLVFWFCALYALVVGVWSLRLEETLAPENRRELALQPVLAAAREVSTTRQTAGYTMAMVFLFGAFTSYLASSELIIGEIYGRPGLFPFIFGGVATGMGGAMLFNARIVERVGVHQTARLAVIGYSAIALVLLAVVFLTEGRPPFWVAIIGISAVLVMHATMIPNVNALALEPLGHMAGMASAVIGTVSLAGGALLGTLIDRNISGTITPLVVGMVVYGLIAAGWMTWAERRPASPSAA
ncbi:MAG: multidrug effflux MFS transporter [Acidimicrobiia bacterium]|nr:multidrug effflux MFS transporter [Acidimicrobiia bacterium]